MTFYLTFAFFFYYLLFFFYFLLLPFFFYFLLFTIFFFLFIKQFRNTFKQKALNQFLLSNAAKPSISAYSNAARPPEMEFMKVQFRWGFWA